MSYPVAFDGCFGVFHPGASTRGVVLCGPIGHEADYAHRAWRTLAQRLAERGLAVLRFDYDGTGDALNEDLSPHRVEAWRASVRHAVAWLKADAAVSEVALVGLRFGAVLTAGCAEEVGGVEALALLAPLASGRAYQRELIMMARLARATSEVDVSGGIDSGGVAYGAETLADLERLALLQTQTTPAKRVLILSRPGVPTPKAMIEAFAERGVEPEQGVFDGYPALMVNADFAEYPQAAFGRLIDWLAEGLTSAPPPPAPAAAELSPPGWRERAVAFREPHPLFGLLCEPVDKPPGRPVLVFVNTGRTTHVGSNRLWVTMARRFAELGFSSLRFDLGGVGESEDNPGQADFLDHIDAAFGDVSAAFDFLAARGDGPPVVVGFCWGAQLACNMALRDPRVAGALLINPRGAFWSEVNADAPYKPGPEAVEAAVGRIRSLGRRGVRTLLLYGLDDPALAETEAFFGVRAQALGELLGIETCFLPGVEHFLLQRAARVAVIEALAERLEGFKTLTPPPA